MQQFDLLHAGPTSGVLFNTELRSTNGIPDTALSTLIAACDLYASPALGEGFGMPYLEALACGTPVAASNYSAHPDFLKGVAWLVDCVTVICEPIVNYWRGIVDIDLWAQAIVEGVNAKEEVRERSRERALEYQWKDIVSKWETVIDQHLTNDVSDRLWVQPIVGV